MGKLKAQTNGLGCAPSITPTEDSLFADFNLEEFFPFLCCETHKSHADKESQAELAQGRGAHRFTTEGIVYSVGFNSFLSVSFKEPQQLVNSSFIH